MGPFTKIHRPRRQQNACARRDGDHAWSAEARTARSTVVNWTSSRPDTTRTTAPARLISITEVANAVGAASPAGMASVTIETKAGAAGRGLSSDCDDASHLRCAATARPAADPPANVGPRPKYARQAPTCP